MAASSSISEIFPMHAKIADKFNIIRSVAHEFADHGGGHKRLMTGRVPLTPVDTVNDAPATGSIVAKCRENRDYGIPNYVSMNPGGRTGDVFAQGAAYLSQAYLPFTVEGDPTTPNFVVPNVAPTEAVTERVDDRMRLLGSLDRIDRQNRKQHRMAAKRLLVPRHDMTTYLFNRGRGITDRSLESL
jgi:hypothetical protein